MAERWDISADAKTWTFHLRADARWSNGDPLTAEQFVDALLEALKKNHDEAALKAAKGGAR